MDLSGEASTPVRAPPTSRSSVALAWGAGLGLVGISLAGTLHTLRMPRDWGAHNAAELGLGVLGVMVLVFALAGMVRQARNGERLAWERAKRRQDVMENIPSAVCLLEAQVDGEFRCVICNSRSARLTCAAACREDRSGGVVCADRLVLRTLLQTSEMDGPVAYRESVEVDGERWELEGEVIPLESGEVGRRRLLVVENDVTERLHLEAQLRQAQKMEAVGHLTGGIAHDFNNHLTVILGNAELLYGDSTGEAKELAGEIRDTAVRSADLVRKLLAFGRRDALRYESLSVSELLREHEMLIRRLLPDHIELDLSIEEDLPKVRGDSTALGQVLLNLITNARDAMPEGGVVRVVVGRRTIRAPLPVLGETLEAGDYVSIAVRDTGTGMSPEVRERAFEPFFTTKALGVGTGLGLSMVHGLIRQHDGHVRLESMENGGTTVEILLRALDGVVPADPDSVQGRPRRSAIGPHGSSQGTLSRSSWTA